jgi:DNA-binding GntR family transcriptional regulator
LDLKAVKTGPLAPKIFEELRRAIISMELKPGQNLSEKEIADQIGVSRQPVREAFIKLREAGLVEVLPQRGTYVVGISIKQVLEARFIRESLEIGLIMDTVGRTNPEFEARMAYIMARQRAEAEASNWTGFLKWDDVFHKAFADYTGRERAWKVIEAEKVQMDRVRHLTYSGQSRMERLLRQHQAILDSVIAGDKERTEKAVREHFTEILKSMSAIAKEHPELFEDYETGDSLPLTTSSIN